VRPTARAGHVYGVCVTALWILRSELHVARATTRDRNAIVVARWISRANNARAGTERPVGFFSDLAQQRWDDHRYYHQSRINQSLHLVSALTFICSYVLLFIDPAAAVFAGWLIAMVTRQSGHFFFEPKDYDKVNRATHEYKEQVKVGYNLQRKVVLLSIWALSPFVLFVDPTLLGVFPAHADVREYLDHVAMMWLVLSGAALLFRMAQLTVQDSAKTAIVWITKIITDPFHDVMLYHKAPLYLLRGQLIDPMDDVRARDAELTTAAQ
jgi:hypothetical protein